MDGIDRIHGLFENDRIADNGENAPVRRSFVFCFVLVWFGAAIDFSCIHLVLCSSADALLSPKYRHGMLCPIRSNSYTHEIDSLPNISTLTSEINARAHKNRLFIFLPANMRTLALDRPEYARSLILTAGNTRRVFFLL